MSHGTNSVLTTPSCKTLLGLRLPLAYKLRVHLASSWPKGGEEAGKEWDMEKDDRSCSSRTRMGLPT